MLTTLANCAVSTFVLLWLIWELSGRLRNSHPNDRETIKKAMKIGWIIVASYVAARLVGVVLFPSGAGP